MTDSLNANELTTHFDNIHNANVPNWEHYPIENYINIVIGHGEQLTKLKLLEVMVEPLDVTNIVRNIPSNNARGKYSIEYNLFKYPEERYFAVDVCRYCDSAATILAQPVKMCPRRAHLEIKQKCEAYRQLPSHLAATGDFQVGEGRLGQTSHYQG